MNRIDDILLIALIVFLVTATLMIAGLAVSLWYHALVCS